MFRLVTIGLAAVALTLVAGAAAFAGDTVAPARNSATSPNPSTFTDLAGDNGSAPDITNVSVGSDPTATFTVAITTNQPVLASTAWMLIFLDTDMNQSTGDPTALGADYAIEVDGNGHGPFLYKLSNQAPAQINAPSLKASSANGVTTITINASDLANTKGFNLWVRSVDGNDLSAAGHYDDAPDNGTWTYQLAGTPSLTLSVEGLVVGRVKAGNAFDVAMLVARSDGADLVNETVACKASINGKRLAVYGSVPPLLVTPALCDWQLPKSSRGKTISGSITVRDGAATVSRTFRARIR